MVTHRAVKRDQDTMEPNPIPVKTALAARRHRPYTDAQASVRPIPAP
jgi:hypothetical protein